MSKRKYDFAGWATKNNLVCSDGVTIKHGAFATCDGIRVPMVWNHGHDDPEKVLGHVDLEYRHNQGIYCYGTFNNTSKGQHSKDMVRHGDIVAMSIAANKLKRSGSDILDGNIYEVSLVLKGANPGAMIEEVLTHDGLTTDNSMAVIYSGKPINLYEDLEHNDKEDEDTLVEKDESLDYEEISDEDLEKLLDEMSDEELAELEEYLNHTYGKEKELEHSEEENTMGKRNLFEQNSKVIEQTEELNGLLHHAQENGLSLKAVMKEEGLQHGISNISLLFPDATNVNKEPYMLRNDRYDITATILGGVTKVPFSKIRSVFADLKEDTARAKGYITGNEKLEQVFKILNRTTNPTTVYKKQALDRDDVLDITEFNVVQFIQNEMKLQLEDEIARAILVGDGRDLTSSDKIDEDCIRPIAKDHSTYVIRTTNSITNAEDWVKEFMTARAQYRGSGNITMFINPTTLLNIKFAKATDGRFLFGSILTNEQVAGLFGVSKVIETPLVTDGLVALDLRDYKLGATKGGEITNFEDFDIDYNKMKYLIETRLTGALTMPKSAIVITNTRHTDEEAWKPSEDRHFDNTTSTITGDLGNRTRVGK